MILCKHVRAHLSEQHDGELTGWYARYVWLHSRVCPPCKRTRLALEETVSLLRRLRDEDPAAAADEDG
ncbi:MAG: hypothetical protein KF819_35105 [Labilithrix sp.]|nr:hypothetical protein [Labilithrix sp.]